ncbi:MAG: hypothetical protein ACREP9_05785, partial [Candidatus Dormibacteraceae bacterium]
MARFVRPVFWLVSVALLGALVAGFTACGTVSGDPPSVPAASPAQDACTVPAAPSTFNEQFLIAGDVVESNTFFVYKLDQQTGVPTAMPWSPMLLDGFVMSETVDASGDYLYLGLGIGLTSNALETFQFPRDGSAPARLDSQPVMADRLAFDPQQRYLYALKQANLTNSPNPADNAALSIFRIDPSHVPHDTNQTIMLSERAPSFGFKDQGRVVVVSREHQTYGNTGIAVLNRDCKTGRVVPASETPILRSLFLAVPSVGNGILAYRLCCDPNAPTGAQLSRYDPSNQSVAAVSNGTLLDTFEAAVDHASDFVVTYAAEHPNQPGP